MCLSCLCSIGTDMVRGRDETVPDAIQVDTIILV